MKTTTLLLISVAIVSGSVWGQNTGVFQGLPSAATSEIETDLIIQPPASDPASSELKLELSIANQGYGIALSKDGANRHYVTQHLLGLTDGQWKWTTNFAHPYYSGLTPRSIMTLDANNNTLTLYGLPDSSSYYSPQAKVTIGPGGLWVAPSGSGGSGVTVTSTGVSVSGYGSGGTAVSLTPTGISVGQGASISMNSYSSLNLNGASLNMGTGTITSSGSLSSTAVAISRSLNVGQSNTTPIPTSVLGAAAIGDHLGVLGNQVVVGRYNDTRQSDTSTSPTSDHTRGVFIVGAGSGNASDPLTTQTRNAMRVRPDGVILIRKQGDLDMGEFTQGETP